MDGRCKTCKWWAPVDPGFHCSGETDLVCLWDRTINKWILDPQYLGWGECERFSPFEDDSLAVQLTTYVDSAGVFTAPDFGCVQWAPKASDS